MFRYQAAYNPVYRQYIRYLRVRPDQINALHQVPFMPIGFFKQHPVLTGVPDPANTQSVLLMFASSGTTGSATSHHYVPDPDLYGAISTRIFEQTYGSLQNTTLLALLPSYLERNNSSLVYMVQQFIERSRHGQPDETPAASGFYLNDYDALTGRLRSLTEEALSGNKPVRKVILIGVTFALLDWAESGLDLSFLSRHPNLVVMETGGMKGRRKELLREEVHDLLTDRLGVAAIHSEYGMTELLSQAYSTGGGVFQPSSTLRVLLRDVNDPFLLYTQDQITPTMRRTGGINVVDLANVDSCSFIETQDLGQHVGTNGDFRVIGRFDNSDVRGCNLLAV